MTDKVYDPARSCHRKYRYVTHAQAQAVATNVLRTRGTVLRIYECTECGGHHLTHHDVLEPKPGWREPEVNKRVEAELDEKNAIRNTRRRPPRYARLRRRA